MALFKIEEFSFRYPEESKAALTKVDIEIEEGSFVVICGKSGCGKTTLLRHLKPLLAPYGLKSGRIYFNNELIEQMQLESQATKLGYVLQNPEQQIVTDKVWHELAFGLENLGYSTEVIRLRVAEMASFFGIQGWFTKSVEELSGGQKQLLNLAAVMAMQPEVLILDEPTAQLDPIAAKNFLEMIKRINSELGITIILSEHRLEEVLPMASQVIVMEEGHVLVQGSVQEVGRYLEKENHELLKAMPTPMQVAYGVSKEMTRCPVTVREGRAWLKKRMGEEDLQDKFDKEKHLITKPKKRWKAQEKGAIRLKDIYFRYKKESEEVLKGFSCCIKAGSLYAIVGGNGTGKTTALSIMAGLYKPIRGTVYKENKAKTIMLPQNPQDLFECSTVHEELTQMLEGTSYKKDGKGLDEVRRITEKLGIGTLLAKHPYDLSGGQMQLVALAKVLLLQPRILLLDEPTKGIDAYSKEKLGEIFNVLKREGMTLVMVSHDLTFCAQYADECALVFDGQIMSQGTPHAFFAENSFYTTAANRMSRGIIEECITAQEVISACKR